MKTDGKIYIIVTDRLPGGTMPPAPQPRPNPSPTEEGKEGDSGLLAHWARERMIGLVRRMAMTAVTYTVGNIGNFTGDYMLQTHVNEAINNVRGLINIGTAALAGFKVTGSPIGAVIGAGLEIANQGISAFTQIHSNLVQNSKTNYEIEQLRNRAGLNPTTDGSRGTEN